VKGSERTSDADGLLHWENLRPGEVEFRCVALDHPGVDGTQLPYSRWWREDEPVKWRKVDASVKPPVGRDGVEALYIDAEEGLPVIRVFMEKGVKFSGVVVDAAGAPAQGVSVGISTEGSFTGDSRYTATTNALGEFSGYAPAGNGLQYRLCAYVWPYRPTPGANAVSESFDSRPGDALTFRLTMAKGAWLTGRLVDAQGQPVKELKVSTTALDHRDISYGNRIAITDATGNFRIGPLRPGAYELKLGSGKSQSAPISVIPGFTSPKVDVSDGQELHLGQLTAPPIPAEE
jgi:hypothetical protein